MEPSGAHYGQLPLDPSFITAARAACTATGTLLVFDEVVTGFRVAPGGMQSVLGITPDISVLGKVMAGGLPSGAVAGRADLLELLATTIAHPGTFNANPLSAAAGIATLQLVADGAPQQTAEGYAVTLASEWTAALATAGVPGTIRRLSSILHIFLGDPSAQARIANAMRAEGVDILNTSAFCSSVHTIADLELSVAAFERAIVAAVRPGSDSSLRRGRAQIIPCRCAQSAAWTRSSTPRRSNTDPRWAFTVFSLIPRRHAICLLLIPRPTSVSTSSSR